MKKNLLLFLCCLVAQISFAQERILEFVVRGDDGLAVWDDTREALRDSVIIVTAIETQNTENISISPNPADEYVRILGITEQTKIKIYNQIGVIIKQVYAKEIVYLYDVPQGVYFMETKNKVFKLVKL